MLKAILLVVSMLVVSGCAGDRKSTGLVANQTDSAEAVGTSFTLQFSSINPALDGSGTTTVVVKLKSGDVVVTDGELATVKVTLKYRVSNPEGDDYFKEFAAGSKRNLQRGAATFRVRLEAGEMHQLLAEAFVKDKVVSGESGIFLVPQGEMADGDEESP